MSPPRIDLHHHVFPPEYLATLDRLGLKGHGGGDMAFPDWSMAASLEMMDRYGIRAAIVSFTSRGEGAPNEWQ